MSALVDEQRLEAAPTGDPKLPRIKPHTTSEIKQQVQEKLNQEAAQRPVESDIFPLG